MKIVLCMATGQNAVNILPLESEKIRPEWVCVGITAGMRQQGLDLITQLKSSGYKTEMLELQDENSLQALTQDFETWLETHIDDEILVNLTGGNKLMALAAYQVFSGYGFRCFYQIYQTNQLVWLDDESRESHIGHKISLERYLAQYQFRLTDKQPIQQIPEQHRLYSELMMDYLRRNFEHGCQLVSQLNGMAAQKIAASTRAEIRKHLSLDEVAFIEHLAHETELFKLTTEGLRFPSEADQALVAGGWLEVLVGQTIKAQVKSRDLSLNVVFEKSTARVGSASKNEMDVMAMIGATLHLVECKTVNWDGKNPNRPKPEDSIYKLAALSDIGGLNTRALFVSLYDLNPAVKTRAAENQIELICGKDLLGLAAHLKRWAAADL